MSPARIALLGVFGVGNFGNEATLAAYLRLLRIAQPGCQITCIGHNPDQITRDHGVPAVSITALPHGSAGPLVRRLAACSPVRQWRMLRFLGGFDALVVPGTGILDDYATPPEGLPWQLFHWIRAARIRRVPTYLLAVGAGPIVHPSSRRFMARAACLARFRSYRDVPSKDFALSLGVPAAHDPVVPDIAFLYAAPPSRPQSASGRKACLGLGVMAYFGWSGNRSEGSAVFAEYLGKLTRLARWAIDQGFSLRLLAGEGNDQEAVDVLAERLRQELPSGVADRIEARPQSSMDDFLREIETVDVAVVSRYHNLIGAFCRGIPTVSLGYSEKNDSLMADFELAGFTQSIEHFDVDRLLAQVSDLAAQRPELSSRIQARALAHSATIAHHLREASRFAP